MAKNGWTIITRWKTKKEAQAAIRRARKRKTARPIERKVVKQVRYVVKVRHKKRWKLMPRLRVFVNGKSAESVLKRAREHYVGYVVVGVNLIRRKPQKAQGCEATPKGSAYIWGRGSSKIAKEEGERLVEGWAIRFKKESTGTSEVAKTQIWPCDRGKRN